MRVPRFLHLIPIAALAAAAIACTDDPAATTAPDLNRTQRFDDGPTRVSVMTRNMYIGFDGDAALAALATGDPAVFGPVLQEAIATLQATDITARAARFADEIARNRPHVVGLQEVYEIHADLTPLGVPAVIDLDFLQILQAALAARHLDYQVVATVVDTDMQPFPGIRLVDRDVMLVDARRVSVGPGVIAKTFAYNVGPIAPGVDKRAGYIAADLGIGGADVRMVTTHLESDLGPASHPQIAQLRAAQAMEIAGALGAAPFAIVIGDLNDDPGSPFYQVFTAPAPAGAGLTDVWASMRPRNPGLTAGCFGPALNDRFAHCDRRIDFVLARGFAQDHAGLAGKIELIGLDRWDRVSGPAGLIWPSDHAGLVADLVTPRERGHDR